MSISFSDPKDEKRVKTVDILHRLPDPHYKTDLLIDEAEYSISRRE